MFNTKYFAIIGLLGVVSVFIKGTRPGPYNNVEKFGPFYIITRSVDHCSIPGPVDMENLCPHNLAVYKISRILEVFRGNIEVPHDLHNFSSFVSTDIWRDGGYKPFFSSMYRKSCELGLVSSMLRKFLKADKKCVIRKGNYTIDEVNPTEMMKEVIGNKFFYEKISLTLALYTKEGLVGCVKLALESKPPPKTALRNIYNNRTRI